MKKYQNHTLKEYLDGLSSRTPVPGGGSAAALVGALGTALISMVANYSLKRNPSRLEEAKIQEVLRASETIRGRLLELVDGDAQAYQRVVKARRLDSARKKAALKEARAVPQEVCRLCQKALPLAAFLVQKGNPYLKSDARLAGEFLQAAFRASRINVEINQ